MTKEQFDKFTNAMYASYVNVARKMGLNPIEYRQFRMRMRIWEW